MREEIYADMIEIEAVWGPDICKLFLPLAGLEAELSRNIQLFLSVRNPSRDQGARNASATLLKRRREVMYDALEEEDKFKDEFDGFFNSLERALRLKLGS